MPKLDTTDKLGAGFRAIRGRVLSYSVPLKKYQIRPDQANYGVIECPAVDYGQDSPYGVNDEVLLQRIPNQGWLILGRIPVARDSLSNTIQKPDGPADKAGEISYQEPGNDEPLFHAQPGDFVVRRGKLKMILSVVGVFAIKVSDTCARYMSKAKSTIVDRCFDYLLSVPRATVNLFLDRQTEQPKLQAQFNPQTALNAMRFSMGGGSADGEDGFDLAMGQFTRLLFQMLPGNQKIVYTQNGPAKLRVESDVGSFLLQFGTGQFRWDDQGLTVTKDSTLVQVKTDSLVLSTPTATLRSASLGVETGSADVNATGQVTVNAQFLVMQQFHWLTVVQRLNSLSLAFATHAHEGNLGLPTTPPLPLPLGPVNEKGGPFSVPIAAGELPLSV
jgi:hypothetical protein